jgi:radical SAM-linked protein
MAKLRLMITKGDPIRYVSHLDFAGTLERVVRRAKFPVAYSEGFNPHMKMAFASALAVGVTSEAEYLDLELTEEAELDQLKEQFAAQLPAGIELKTAQYVRQPSKALMAIVNLAVYEIVVPLLADAAWDAIENSVQNFNNEVQVIYTKQTPKGRRELDIKEYLAQPAVVKSLQDNSRQASIALAIKIMPNGSVKPVEVLAALIENFEMPVDKDAALIHRNGLFITDGKVRRSPFEVQ